MNVLLWKEKGSYAYFLGVVGKIWLLKGVRSLYPFLKSGKQNMISFRVRSFRVEIKTFPTLTPCNLCMFMFMIIFTSCFRMRKAQSWGTFSKCEAKFNYCLILGPLFWECPQLGWGFTLHLITKLEKLYTFYFIFRITFFFLEIPVQPAWIFLPAEGTSQPVTISRKWKNPQLCFT
jgi:hypothetical protein